MNVPRPAASSEWVARHPSDLTDLRVPSPARDQPPQEHTHPCTPAECRIAGPVPSGLPLERCATHAEEAPVASPSVGEAAVSTSAPAGRPKRARVDRASRRSLLKEEQRRYVRCRRLPARLEGAAPFKRRARRVAVLSPRHRPGQAPAGQAPNGHGTPDAWSRVNPRSAQPRHPRAHRPHASGAALRPDDPTHPRPGPP
jgi:hypothetical protein